MPITINDLKLQLKPWVLSLLQSSGTGGGAGTFAPIGAQYLTLAAHASLTAERVLTPGLIMTGTDSGAGAAYTLDIDSAKLSWTSGKLTIAVTAAKTLTLASADDYTFTVPGTGTAALMSFANTGYLQTSTGYLTAAGNTTTPAYRITGDTNTGMYSPGTGQLAWVGAGTERLTMGAFGRFSLRTDQLNCNGAGALALTINNNGNLLIGSSATFVTQFYGGGASSAPWMQVSGTAVRFADITDSGANDAFNITSTTTTQRLMRWKNKAAQSADALTYYDSDGTTILTRIEADGEIDITTDSKYLRFGGGLDAGITYDGTNMLINPKLVGTGFLSILGDISLVDEDIILGTTTGSKIGTATTQKLGFWNATPIVQPAGATQAAPAAYVTGGFGLDSDANMQALYDLVVAMRTALVNSGIMKGSA